MRNLLFPVLALVIAACGGESDNAAAPSAAVDGQSDARTTVNTERSNSYAEAHAAAVAAIAIAADKGHAWSTSDQLIKDAAKAVAEGDEALAISLADEARIHADLAVIQADTEAAAWRDRVITN